MTNCETETGRPARSCRDYRRPAYATGRLGAAMSDAQLRALFDATVAFGFDIDEALLRQPTRGVARVAVARQAAMYLAHVTLQINVSATGRMFERDRTTVKHACRIIEQRRDDHSFDNAIDLLESVVKIVAGPRRAPCAN
jgi:Bacterial dnaA protein helix-turn-helix